MNFIAAKVAAAGGGINRKARGRGGGLETQETGHYIRAMEVGRFIGSTAAWLCSPAGEPSVVMSSRLRLARNLAGHAFPTWAEKSERQKVYEKLMPAVASLPAMQNPMVAEPMDRFAMVEKQLLVEQHLISREHAAKGPGSGVAINSDRSISVLVNEEDHLRIQAFASGFNLKEVWGTVNGIDDSLEASLTFAYSPDFGYLTACPTNVGTGMRASAMLHLPGLVLSEQINQIVQAVGKLGLAVRGLYGEGTEALGNLFQVSNQMTLGESEDDIIGRLAKVIKQVVEHEQNARASLVERKPRMVADNVGRAYGVLTNTYSIASKEALNLLSVIRLGIEIEMMPESLRPVVDDLMISTQPAHLQVKQEKKLSTEDRDGLRADLIREKLKHMERPDAGRVIEPPGGAAEKGKKDE
jgi:protein arginine kinase